MGDALVFKGDCMHAGFDHDVDNTRVHVYVSVSGWGTGSAVPKDEQGYTTIDMEGHANPSGPSKVNVSTPTTSSREQRATKRSRNSWE